MPDVAMDPQQLVETWRINNRINLYLLDAISLEQLADLLSSKGRNVAAQFAHLHNVRLMWLKAVSPAALKSVAKIENDQPIDKELLRSSLTGSGAAIESLLRDAIEHDGRVKGFRPHVPAFLGYMIAHDAHHRSQIIIALKQSGHTIDKKISYGIWEWGSR
jgi:uncharacterized damage-inducible protein DinB